jgi:hypothetical protein
MRANQNFSMELGIYPKSDLTRLSSNSVKTTTLKNKPTGSRTFHRTPRVREKETTTKTR